jgi:hypothetical protein
MNFLAEQQYRGLMLSGPFAVAAEMWCPISLSISAHAYVEEGAI